MPKENPNEEQPIPENIRQIMNDIGLIIEGALRKYNKDKDKQYGFALLVFPFGEDNENRISYISNAHRDDMLAAMKEFIARAENRYTKDSFNLTKKN